MKFETFAIHDGNIPEPRTGAVSVPIYQTSTYFQDGLGKDRGYEYSRSGNPTRAALESTLAGLEGGAFGLAYASGSAATVGALQPLLLPGDEIVAGNDTYGGTYRIFERILRPYNVSTNYVDAGTLDGFEATITPRTKIIWVESPSNPLLKLIDIAALAKIAHAHGARLAVDNTFATPYFQRPLELGADIVVHSTTKYIGGHSDVIGGAIVTSDAAAHAKMKFFQNAAGAVPAPFDAWLFLRGIKTLKVRMEAHEDNAKKIAAFLESSHRVERVYYPGLKSHPQYKLARRQMSGFGGMVSFEIKGGLKAVEKFIAKSKLFLLAESLGGVESLLCYPPRMTHASISPEERAKRGIRDNLIRLSVGIESIDDLLEDLANALQP